MTDRKNADKTPQSDKWKLTPEQADALPPGLSQDDMHAAAARGDLHVWHSIGLAGPPEYRRHDGRMGWRLFWKLPAYTFGAGIPGILLILLQFLFVYSTALQQATGNMTGLVRLLMIITGGILIGIGAPLYRPADWTPQLQEKVDDDREYFKSKRGI